MLLAMRMHGFCRVAVPIVMLMLTAIGCGGKSDTAKGREIPWTYGPTTGGAAAEHVQGAGKGGAAIARGWKCRLLQKQFTITPYQLAGTHPLFGHVVMNIGLFDKEGKQLDTVNSTAVTAANAAFMFELEEDVAAKLLDCVIWFRKA
jgi:hypothetical protein